MDNFPLATREYYVTPTEFGVLTNCFENLNLEENRANAVNILDSAMERAKERIIDLSKTFAKTKKLEANNEFLQYRKERILENLHKEWEIACDDLYQLELIQSKLEDLQIEID